MIKRNVRILLVQNRIQKALSYSVLYLIFAIFSVVSLYPFFLVLITALKGPLEIYKNPIGLPTVLHWENLPSAWTRGKFNIFLKNSVFISFFAVIIVLSFSSLAGFAFAKMRFYGKKIIFLYILLGIMIPIYGIIIPLYLDLRTMHLFNTRWAVIFPLSALGVSFGSFMMRAFFKSSPDELLDSGKIDGCSNLATFFYIFLPIAKPAFIALLVFEFMWSWNVFLFPLVFITSENLRPIQIALMFAQGRYTLDYGLVAGIVTLAIIPIILVYVVFQRAFIQGITAGALKG
jgi:raffinose/stachyose/melibiose transport system permease protein